MKIDWNGFDLELLQGRAIHWARQDTLFVADPHFGKAATFRSLGIPVPETASRATCDRLSVLLNQTKARRLVFLGDFLHAREGRTDRVREDLCAWREGHDGVTMDLVLGNHDLAAGYPWKELRINVHPDPWDLAGLACRHKPQEEPVFPSLSGHLHPVACPFGRRNSSGLSRPCFWIRPMEIVLPAFGEFTGGHQVRGEAVDRLVLLGDESLVEL